MKQVAIYTDGACLGNPGPGGWAALLKYEGRERMISGSESETTNNRMEMRAVVEALTVLKEPCRVTIYTDSRYVMHAFTENWIAGWKQKGWKTSAGKDVANQDLWLELDALIQKHQVSWQWVKGHDGHPENERVDKEARKAAKEQW